MTDLAVLIAQVEADYEDILLGAYATDKWEFEAANDRIVNAAPILAAALKDAIETFEKIRETATMALGPELSIEETLRRRGVKMLTLAEVFLHEHKIQDSSRSGCPYCGTSLRDCSCYGIPEGGSMYG